MPSRIPLIIRLPNWVGDVVMTLPSLQALHAVGFELTLFGQRWIFDLLQAFPAKLVHLPNSFLAAKQVVHDTPANKALLFTNSFSSALTLRLAGKECIGYKNTLRTPLLKKSLSKTEHLHEVEYFWNLAQLAANTWLPEASWPNSTPKTIQLPLSKSCEIKIALRLKQEAIITPFVILCPLATGTAKHGVPKIWPYWSELSEILAQRGVTQLVCPGPLEDERCRQLIPKAHMLSGVSLGELSILFKQAAYVFANDSGPMHVAAATGANVLGIFGTTDPHRTHPWGANYLGELGRWPTLDEVLEFFPQMINAPNHFQ